MEDITAESRFWAVSAGQGCGTLLLLVVVGVSFLAYGKIKDENTRSEIWWGLKMILLVFLAVLVAGLGGFVKVFCIAKESGQFDHKIVDYMLWFFVAIDLLGLLFIVCQQGGLSHSMFLPVFFLIPTAYLAVVNPSKINSTYILLSAFT